MISNCIHNKYSDIRCLLALQTIHVFLCSIHLGVLGRNFLPKMMGRLIPVRKTYRKTSPCFLLVWIRELSSRPLLRIRLASGRLDLYVRGAKKGRGEHLWSIEGTCKPRKNQSVPCPRVGHGDASLPYFLKRLQVFRWTAIMNVRACHGLFENGLVSVGQLLPVWLKSRVSTVNLMPLRAFSNADFHFSCRKFRWTRDGVNKAIPVPSYYPPSLLRLSRLGWLLFECGGQNLSTGAIQHGACIKPFIYRRRRER